MGINHITNCNFSIYQIIDGILEKFFDKVSSYTLATGTSGVGVMRGGYIGSKKIFYPNLNARFSKIISVNLFRFVIMC